jgi:hypothetical protein
MGGLSRFNPPGGFQPAGYLPAPTPARFISEAEQAAEKLPATIKSQSLKNALLKGGAKPLELEYAGIDDFISQNQGKPVSAADVLAHLRTEGPLGQLKRVEQQVVGGQVGGGPPTGRYSRVRTILPGDTPASYATDFRQPFDADRASNVTTYHDWTVQGKNKKFDGYREALIEDPKNSGSPLIPGYMPSKTRELYHEDIGNILDRYGIHNPDAIDWDRIGEPDYITDGDGRQLADAFDNLSSLREFPKESIDAHHSDYWLRSHEHPDRIDIQNVQSDVGQDFTKGGNRDLDAANGRLQEVHESRRLAMAELDNPNTPAHFAEEARETLNAAGEELAEIVNTFQRQFTVEYTPDGEEYFTTKPVSPLGKDDNWKNLALRHAVLQSLQGGGKPITIPTGQQMVDVEGFGGRTHKLNTPEGRAAAIKAADAYNADLVRRLQKIFRGLHPDGASVSTPPVPEPPKDPLITAIGKGTADHERKLFLDQRIYDLEHAMIQQARNKELEGMSVDDLVNQFPLEPEDGYKPEEPDELLLLDRAAKELPAADTKIVDILLNGGSRKDLEIAIKRGGQSDQFREAAMKAIQYDRLMQEMGNPGVVPGTLPPPPLVSRHDLRNKMNAASNEPGWTIKPSPMAVRQGLEKGLPIMSLAPLLLAPQQEQR